MNQDKLKIGTKVKTLVHWSGIYKNTIGYIIDIDEDNVYCIGWDTEEFKYPTELSPSEVALLNAVDHQCPIRDWFTLDEMNNYIVIIEDNEN